MDDLIYLLPSLPAFKVEKLVPTISDKGLSADVSILFENPTVFSLETEKMAFKLSLSEQTICQVLVSKISLDKGYQKLDFQFDVSFDDDSISSANIASMADRIVEKISQGDLDLKLAMQGPLKIDQTGILKNITDPLSLYIPTSPLIAAMKPNNIAKLLSEEGFKSVFQESELKLSIASDRISVTSNLVLPKFLSFPPIHIPSSSKLSVGIDNKPAISILASPIDLSTDKNSTRVSITIDILPEEKSAEASSLLARMFNPLLSSQPSVFLGSFLPHI